MGYYNEAQRARINPVPPQNLCLKIGSPILDHSSNIVRGSMLILVSDGGVHIRLSQCTCVFGFPVRVPCLHPPMVANARCFFPFFIIFILTIVAFTFPVMSSPPGFRFPHSFPFATFARRSASLSRRLPLLHRRHSRARTRARLDGRCAHQRAGN